VVKYRKKAPERSERMKAKKNKRERSPQMQQVSAGYHADGCVTIYHIDAQDRGSMNEAFFKRMGATA
jgi:hypothetical protein